MYSSAHSQRVPVFSRYFVEFVATQSVLGSLAGLNGKLSITAVQVKEVKAASGPSASVRRAAQKRISAHWAALAGSTPTWEVWPRRCNP
eukprot:1185861-Prorocentrum_minimum.AAC.2